MSEIRFCSTAHQARLEREIDNLPVDARFRERKIHDMALRLDGLCDTIVELEERIENARLRRSSIEMEAITLDNIYKLMMNFGKLYDIIFVKIMSKPHARVVFSCMGIHKIKLCRFYYSNRNEVFP